MWLSATHTIIYSQTLKYPTLPSAENLLRPVYLRGRRGAIGLPRISLRLEEHEELEMIMLLGEEANPLACASPYTRALHDEADALDFGR